MITYVTAPSMLLCAWMRKLLGVIAAAVVLLVLLFTTSGTFLIIDEPEPADLIVVLAGETDRRPARGLELLRAGDAPELLLDVPASTKIFNLEMIDIAQKYADSLPEHDRIHICPIAGLSTKTEAQDVLSCISKTTARRIVIVTSDYHTRRALSTFRHELPGYSLSVAASRDSTQFGKHWWKHRQWAKINFDEWVRLAWWEAVDRWRK